MGPSTAQPFSEQWLSWGEGAPSRARSSCNHRPGQSSGTSETGSLVAEVGSCTVLSIDLIIASGAGRAAQIRKSP